MKTNDGAVLPQHSYPGEYRSAIARAKKVLVAAGFPWSTITGRYTPFNNTQKVTAGVTVRRIGCSETVSLHTRDRDLYTAEASEDRRLMQALAIMTLREAGLPFDDRGWLACGRDGKR